MLKHATSYINSQRDFFMKINQLCKIISIASLAASTSVMAEDSFDFDEHLFLSATLLYAKPSTSQDLDYAVSSDVPLSLPFPYENSQIQSVDPDFSAGLQASIGIATENKKNDLIFIFTDFNSSDSDNISGNLSPTNTAPGFGFVTADTAKSEVNFELNSYDLLARQHIKTGKRTDIALGLGLSYVQLEEKIDNFYTTINGEPGHTDSLKLRSHFSGAGPRLAASGRYKIFSGLGFIGGGSVAALYGEMESDYNELIVSGTDHLPVNTSDEVDQITPNFRLNIGLDYQQKIRDSLLSKVGLEVGYYVDYYKNAMKVTQYTDSQTPNALVENIGDISFSGVYATLFVEM